MPLLRNKSMIPYWQSKDKSLTFYVGESLTLLKQFPDRSFDFVFTDPPYGHNNNNGDLIHRWEAALGRGSHGESRAIENDGIEANDLFRSTIPELYRLLSPGCCCCCCCGGGGPDPQFARWSLWLDEVFNFKQMIVWDKGPMGMGWHYRRSYETVLVGEVPGAACRWYDETNAVENIIRSSGKGRIAKIIPRDYHHPTEKPIELPLHFINLHTKPGHIVVDPFMGSGSTAIACMLSGRRFVGIDVSEEFVRQAIANVESAIHEIPALQHLANHKPTTPWTIGDPA